MHSPKNAAFVPGAVLRTDSQVCQATAQCSLSASNSSWSAGVAVPNCYMKTRRSAVWSLASAASEDDSVPAPAAVAESKSASKAGADPAPPPATFYQAIQQSVTAVQAAIADGEKLVEVEFPPLPAAQMESSAVGAYDVMDANIRLAVDFARPFARAGKRVAVQFPDFIEKDRAVGQNNEMDEPVEGIRFGTIRDSGRGGFLERIWTTKKLEPAVREDDDMFVVIGATCQELPDVEALVEEAGDRPVVLFNLKLDSARGDLGLPAFPRKALHYRFLTKALPVYYLRTRTYSRSLKKPPYIVNYSGVLYRVYPGPYQVLLDTSAGAYRRLTTLDKRPSLGEVRDTLTEGLDIEVPFKEFLGQSKTWWESAPAEKETSSKWRV